MFKTEYRLSQGLWVLLLGVFVWLYAAYPVYAWDLWLVTSQDFSNNVNTDHRRILVIRDLDTAPTQVYVTDYDPIPGSFDYYGYNNALGNFAFAPNGTLYGISVTLGSPSGLYTIDPATGAVAHVGDFPFEWGNTLYFHPRTGRGYVGGGLESWSPYEWLHGFYIFTNYDPSTTVLWHDMRPDFPNGGTTMGYAHHDGYLYAFWGPGHWGSHITYLLRITEDADGNFVSYVNLGDVESRGLPRGAWDIISDGVNLYALAPDALYRIDNYQGSGPATYTKILEFDLEDDETVNGVTAPWADLEITLQAAPTSGAPIGAFQITAELTNQGPYPAERVRVQAPVPTGVALYQQTASQGTYVPSTQTWDVGTLAVGDTATLTLTLVPAHAGPFEARAWVTHSSALDPDSSPQGDMSVDDWGDGQADDDEASLTYTPQADLVLSKSVHPTAAGPGEQVTFTLTVTNRGPGGATQIEVTDPLPSGYTYTSSHASQGAYDDATGVWTVGSLAPNDAATLTMTATVNPQGDYTNLAEVATPVQVDPDPDSNQARAGIAYQPQADLELSKTVDPARAHPGDTVTFTLTLTNRGPNEATHVEVTDRLPSGYLYESSAPSQGTYDADKGVWAVGTLAPNATATLLITATVQSGGVYTNTAEVTALEPVDPDATPGDGLGDDYAEVALQVLAPSLPETGFAPGKPVPLAPRPAESLTLEWRVRIPRLGLDAPVVGVPLSSQGWDVRWLADAVGWLHGSAFPTWRGNTVLTAHVWDADNTPGLFYGLEKLRYGDRIVLYAGNTTATYMVVDNRLVTPKDVDAVFAPAETDVLTLVTCQGFNPDQAAYPYRRVVRAVRLEEGR